MSFHVSLFSYLWIAIPFWEKWWTSFSLPPSRFGILSFSSFIRILILFNSYVRGKVKDSYISREHLCESECKRLGWNLHQTHITNNQMNNIQMQQLLWDRGTNSQKVKILNVLNISMLHIIIRLNINYFIQHFFQHLPIKINGFKKLKTFVWKVTSVIFEDRIRTD